MTEEQLLQAVRDLARYRGWLAYHTYRSTKSEPGFPDLVLVHPRTGQVVFAELKTATGLLSKAQQGWLAALRVAQSHRLSVHVWRPADLASGLIGRVLTPTASAAGATQ
ncbi:VRR-NUC domain-containing protein [Modestobacter sp. VKM Ac-2985]|uniref:VRR-NUC domain-containing protein n=1 Tax=Modestobacter sp. VKM Ac-2985 TaxID=3004139 RepID=UPI0022AB696E|nr:VRR-NUC domain-containing protein [Modestobacter sp. VKM Ac-2985]MCZ2837166.1 VRR-NUC domain-containing protein [Modestobacter sp. VKM Ac-2985]